MDQRIKSFLPALIGLVLLVLAGFTYMAQNQSKASTVKVERVDYSQAESVRESLSTSASSSISQKQVDLESSLSSSLSISLNPSVSIPQETVRSGGGEMKIKKTCKIYGKTETCIYE